MIPVDICGVVLGSPYPYDRDVVFHRKEHKYHLKKDGIEYIVKAHKLKTHLDLVTINQMKRLISSSKRYVLMVVKEQHKDQHDAFSCCESQFKDILVKVVDSFQSLLKEPKHLSPKWEIQHEIQLMYDAPLPNVGNYRMSVIENEKIKKQIQ